MSVGQAGVTNAEKQSTPRGAILDIVRANDKTVLAFNGNSYDNKAHLFLYNAVGDRKVNSSNNSLDNLESIDISTDYNTGYMFGDIKGACVDAKKAVSLGDKASDNKSWINDNCKFFKSYYK